MEIFIDARLVRRILREEIARARTEISHSGVLRAYENSQQRHDERISAAPDACTLACRAGCTWCCHFSVDVRAVEVFRILDYMSRNFTPAEQAHLRTEIEANSARLRDLDETQRMQVNVKCPFLTQGHCTIYAARPQTCRNYHATDAAGCRRSFEEPENLNIDPEFAPGVYQAGGAHVDAFCSAMRDAGYDTQAYELNAALAAALSQPATRQLFEARMPPFDLQGVDVPMEFTEQDP